MIDIPRDNGSIAHLLFIAGGVPVVGDPRAGADELDLRRHLLADHAHLLLPKRDGDVVDDSTTAPEAPSPGPLSKGLGGQGDGRPDVETPRPGGAPWIDGFSHDDSPLHGGPAVEAFRMLALGVDRLMPTSSPWSVAVVGAFPDHGYRRVVTELLARALSELRPPVRLVDADPEEAPRVTRGPADQPAPSAQFAPIPLGTRLAAFPQALADEVRRTVDREAEEHHTVVIHTPPATRSSLAFALAGIADAAIYVARSAGSSSPVHAQIRDHLDLLGIRVLGVIVDEG